MSTLPFDTLVNIVLFLQPRDACRVTAVCRSWFPLYRGSGILLPSSDLVDEKEFSSMWTKLKNITEDTQRMQCFGICFPSITRNLRRGILQTYLNPLDVFNATLSSVTQTNWPKLTSFKLDLRYAYSIKRKMMITDALLRFLMHPSLMPQLSMLEIVLGNSVSFEFIEMASKALIQRNELQNHRMNMTECGMSRTTEENIRLCSLYLRCFNVGEDRSGLKKCFGLFLNAMTAGIDHVHVEIDNNGFGRLDSAEILNDDLMNPMQINPVAFTCVHLEFSFGNISDIPYGFFTTAASPSTLRHLCIRVSHGSVSGYGWDAWVPGNIITRMRAASKEETLNEDIGSPTNHHLRRLLLDLEGVQMTNKGFSRLWFGAMRCFRGLDILTLDARGAVVQDADLQECAQSIMPQAPRSMRIRLSSQPGLSTNHGPQALQNAAQNVHAACHVHIDNFASSKRNLHEGNCENDDHRRQTLKRMRECLTEEH